MTPLTSVTQHNVHMSRSGSCIEAKLVWSQFYVHTMSTIYIYIIHLHLQSELSEMAAKRDSLDAQLVTVIEEKRALLSTERELTSKMVSIIYCSYSTDYNLYKNFSPEL